jgi:xanthine/uracil/vitamin C permease (AzgA family)
MMMGAADFPVHLGLARLDWPASVGRGVVLGIAIFLGLAGIAWYAMRSLRQMGSVPPPSPLERPGWTVGLDAFFQEAHWAFYRVPGILLTGDFLFGTFIGALLAILERVADSRWRRRATSPQSDLEAWHSIALLVGMSVSFYFTRNLFVLWVIHAIVDWGNRQMTRWLVRRASETASV